MEGPGWGWDHFPPKRAFWWFQHGTLQSDDSHQGFNGSTPFSAFVPRCRGLFAGRTMALLSWGVQVSPRWASESAKNSPRKINGSGPVRSFRRIRLSGAKFGAQEVLQLKKCPKAPNCWQNGVLLNIRCPKMGCFPFGFP